MTDCGTLRYHVSFIHGQWALGGVRCWWINHHHRHRDRQTIQWQAQILIKDHPTESSDEIANEEAGREHHRPEIRSCNLEENSGKSIENPPPPWSFVGIKRARHRKSALFIQDSITNLMTLGYYLFLGFGVRWNVPLKSIQWQPKKKKQLSVVGIFLLWIWTHRKMGDRRRKAKICLPLVNFSCFFSSRGWLSLNLSSSFCEGWFFLL